MKTTLLSLAAPFIVGPLTFFVMQGAKSVSTAVDKLSPAIKRVAVALIATGLTLLGGWAGVDLNCSADAAVNCLDTLDKDAVKAVVAAVVAFGLHAMKAAKAKAD